MAVLDDEVCNDATHPSPFSRIRLYSLLISVLDFIKALESFISIESQMKFQREILRALPCNTIPTGRLQKRNCFSALIIVLFWYTVHTRNYVKKQM